MASSDPEHQAIMTGKNQFDFSKYWAQSIWMFSTQRTDMSERIDNQFYHYTLFAGTETLYCLL